MKLTRWMIVTMLVAGSALSAPAADARGPEGFTTHSPVPIGINTDRGVIVGIEEHKLGDIVRYLPIAYEGGRWNEPSRRMPAYLVSPSRPKFKEKYAKPREQAEKLFRKLGATQAAALTDEVKGRFRSFVEGLTIYVHDDEIRADTGGVYGDETLVLHRNLSELNRSCEVGTHRNRLLHVSVLDAFGVVAMVVESACDTPKGVNYRRKLLISELPALMERLAALGAP